VIRRRGGGADEGFQSRSFVVTVDGGNLLPRRHPQWRPTVTNPPHVDRDIPAIEKFSVADALPTLGIASL
jgi:hypothetical protein